MSKLQFAPASGCTRFLDKMVIRAGAAISPLQMNMDRNQISAYPDVITNSNASANSFIPVTNLTIGLPPIVPPTAVNGTITVPKGTGNLVTDPQHFVRGYIESWNLTLQREFRAGFLGSLAYVGSHNVNLFGLENINYAPIGGGNASLPFFSQGITGSVSEFNPIGAAHFESLQASLTKRFSQGLTMQASYTYSHEIGLCCGGEETAPSLLDPAYLYLAVATMPLDRTQNLHISTSYQLPFERESPIFNMASLRRSREDGL